MPMKETNLRLILWSWSGFRGNLSIRPFVSPLWGFILYSQTKFRMMAPLWGWPLCGINPESLRNADYFVEINPESFLSGLLRRN